MCVVACSDNTTSKPLPTIVADATSSAPVSGDDGATGIIDAGTRDVDHALGITDGLTEAREVGILDATPALDVAILNDAQMRRPDADAVIRSDASDDGVGESTPTIIQDTGDELVLLFVGNSYVNSNNLPNIVCELARQTGRWQRVDCRSVTAGGYRLTQHAADAEAGHQLGQFLDPNHPERPPWDAVILQEQSQIPGFPLNHAEVLSFEQAVIDLDRRIAAIGAETALMMTWGRRDGDSRNMALYPDYPTMQTRLRDGYERAVVGASSAVRRVYLIPAGLAWRATFQRDPMGDFLGLYSRDGSHPAFAGSWLTALVLLHHLVGVEPGELAPLGDRPALELSLRLRQDARSVPPQ